MILFKMRFRKTTLSVLNLSLLVALFGLQCVAQSEPPATNAGAPPAASSGVLTGDDNDGSAMLTPPPVAGSGYSMAFDTERRSNYLRGGVTFQAAHDDGLLTAQGDSLSDWSYSIWPTIALDQTWPRFHWTVAYLPGFTFYQNASQYNQQDQNLAISAEWRLSPHVTLGVHDGLQRSSNLYNQPLLESASSVTGVAQGPNNSIVSPVSDVLRNTAGADLSYQFGRNDMVGASGTFSNLHFLNPSQVNGLYDSAARGGAGFYTHRFSARHYLGAAYLYQDLLTYPVGPSNETITQSALGFYSFYPRRTLAFSVFAGPQYSDTVQFGGLHVHGWSALAGTSASWQGKRTSVAASYLRSITDGGGLVGAVRSNSVNLSLRQQLTGRWSAGAQAGYSQNTLLQPAAGFNSGGHTLLGSVWAQRLIGPHFTAQVGYSHVHQSYSGIPALAGIADRNREWVALTYQFVRPLGK